MNFRDKIWKFNPKLNFFKSTWTKLLTKIFDVIWKKKSKWYQKISSSKKQAFHLFHQTFNLQKLLKQSFQCNILWTRPNKHRFEKCVREKDLKTWLLFISRRTLWTWLGIKVQFYDYNSLDYRTQLFFHQQTFAT